MYYKYDRVRLHWLILGCFSNIQRISRTVYSLPFFIPNIYELNYFCRIREAFGLEIFWIIWSNRSIIWTSYIIYYHLGLSTLFGSERFYRLEGLRWERIQWTNFSSEIIYRKNTYECIPWFHNGHLNKHWSGFALCRIIMTFNLFLRNTFSWRCIFLPLVKAAFCWLEKIRYYNVSSAFKLAEYVKSKNLSIIVIW